MVLDIFGHTMSIWILVSIILITAQLLQDSGFSCIRKISLKIKEQLVWNGLIRIALETNIYIFLG